MNEMVPPSSVKLGDIGLRGSRTIVINPKSARHALGGMSFVMRMFAYWRIRKKSYTSGSGQERTPLISPWVRLAL